MNFIKYLHIQANFFVLLFLLGALILSIIKPVLLSASQLEYHDKVIRKDEIWSGEVIVKGVVVVGRGATLIIKPGTKIRFRKIDRNNDGIGDSEIRVLGRLLAEGTEKSPVTFLSAESKPSNKDWSYVLIFASGEVNKLQFCIFQHAFTGLQVHFSTAELTNSIFKNNFEGIRFGRAKFLIKNNTLLENYIGIRFTRMEGPATITANKITQNRIGIFLVPSGQNIQNFFEPDRSGKPWNTGRLTISGNNIYANTEYNLSLGEKQIWDLDVTGNWWGTKVSSEIKKLIFDFYRDPSLGKALFLPTAEDEIANAGFPGNELMVNRQKEARAVSDLRLINPTE